MLLKVFVVSLLNGSVGVDDRQLAATFSQAKRPLQPFRLVDKPKNKLSFVTRALS